MDWRHNPAANADNPGFTGHIRDTATGLTYAQARYYDPAIGRFLSNDPVGFAEGGLGYFNRYAYSANDPINLVDRTGECFAPPFIGTCTGFLIGGASEIVKQARNGDIQRPEAGWLSMDALSAIRSEADWRAVGSASFEGAAWGTLGGAIGAQAGRAISNGAELTGLKKYGVQIASAGLANISVQVGKGFIGLWGRVAEGAIETQVTEVEAVEVPIDEFPPLRVEVDCGRLDPDGTEGGNC